MLESFGHSDVGFLPSLSSVVKRHPLSALVLAAVTGCVNPNKDSGEAPDSGLHSTDTRTTSVPFTPATGTVVEPRSSATVFQPTVHLFTNFWGVRQTQEAAYDIKVALFGGANAETCYQNVLTEKRVQYGVQTEFITTDCERYPTVEDCFPVLDERLDVLDSAGLAVDLLLPVHQRPSDGWLGVNWNNEAAWANSSTFVPYPPTSVAYDVLSEQFQVPIIRHLVESGRAPRLSSIYVANEFGFINDTDAEDSLALAATAKRLYSNAVEAADGQVPIGLKFARLDTPETGWTPDTVNSYDPLADVLGEMASTGGVLGYDAYINDNASGGGSNFDQPNRDRLSPFLDDFPDGRFKISEFGRECSGSTSLTTPDDFTGTASAWEADGASLGNINAFAWYTDLCYSIANSSGNLLPGGQDVLDGLKAVSAAALDLDTSEVFNTPCDAEETPDSGVLTE